MEPIIYCIFSMSRSLALSPCIKLKLMREYLSSCLVTWTSHLITPSPNYKTIINYLAPAIAPTLQLNGQTYYLATETLILLFRETK